MVIWASVPSAAARIASTASEVGAVSTSAACAPLKSGARNGPSACRPMTSDRSRTSSAPAASDRQRPSIVSETYDSASRRVPCRRCTARIVSSPARPSSALAPPAPWQWMSTKAGARYPPAPSMTSTLAEAARSFQPSPRPRAMTVSPDTAIHVSADFSDWSADSSEWSAGSTSRMEASWKIASVRAKSAAHTALGGCAGCVIGALPSARAGSSGSRRGSPQCLDPVRIDSEHMRVQEGQHGAVPDLGVAAAEDPVPLVREVEEPVLRVAVPVERRLRLGEQVEPQLLALPDRHPVVLVAVDDEQGDLDLGGEAVRGVLGRLLPHRLIPGGVVRGPAHRGGVPQGGVGDDALEC